MPSLCSLLSYLVVLMHILANYASLRRFPLLSSTKRSAMSLLAYRNNYIKEAIPAELELSHGLIECIVRSWAVDWVQRLGLCPWSGQVLVKQRMRIVTFPHDPTQPHYMPQLENLLIDECRLLLQQEDNASQLNSKVNPNPPHTTLIVLPHLTDFDTYLDLHAFSEDLLDEYDLDPDIQIASFHPDYQFQGTAWEDVENFTNRSPLPLLHLLKVDEVRSAIESVQGDTAFVYQQNIALLRRMGQQKVHDTLLEVVRRGVRDYQQQATGDGAGDSKKTDACPLKS
eukprot:gene33779-40874_t